MKIIIIVSFIILLFILKGIHRKKKGKNKIIHIEDDLCARCSVCVRKCRHNVLRMVDDDNGLHIKIQNPDNCTACNDCVRACSFKALSLIEKR